MSKETKDKIVPKLRFWGFAEQEWQKNLIGNVVKKITTGKLDANAMVENGKYRFYTCAKNYYWIDNYAFDTEALLIAGNGAYLGYIHYYKGKFNAYQRTYVLSDFNVNVFYLKYYLDRFLPSRIATEKKDGNTPYIVLRTITDTPLLVPKQVEQQKIASCLFSLDEYITAESQKLEALKTHKKGLMQQLFPAEGERVPKLRFKEFRDSGEWEEKRLGELLQFKNGINASKELYGKGVKFINVLDILQNEFINYEKIIGSVDVSDEIANNFSVNYGDILFQRSSETQEEVGTSNVYLDKNRPATFGGFVIRGKKIGEYDPIFLNKLLKTPSMRESISSKSGGSTRFNIGQEILSSTKIFLPFLKEQQKIASCLSSLDELITVQAEKIEALKEHKKGLMQGLFPN